MCRCGKDRSDLFLPDEVRNAFFNRECPVQRITFPFDKLPKLPACARDEKKHCKR